MADIGAPRDEDKGTVLIEQGLRLRLRPSGRKITWPVVAQTLLFTEALVDRLQAAQTRLLGRGSALALATPWI